MRSSPSRGPAQCVSNGGLSPRRYECSPGLSLVACNPACTRAAGAHQPYPSRPPAAAANTVSHKRSNPAMSRGTKSHYSSEGKHMHSPFPPCTLSSMPLAPLPCPAMIRQLMGMEAPRCQLSHRTLSPQSPPMLYSLANQASTLPHAAMCSERASTCTAPLTAYLKVRSSKLRLRLPSAYGAQCGVW